MIATFSRNRNRTSAIFQHVKLDKSINCQYNLHPKVKHVRVSTLIVEPSLKLHGCMSVYVLKTEVHFNEPAQENKSKFVVVQFQRIQIHICIRDTQGLYWIRKRGWGHGIEEIKYILCVTKFVMGLHTVSPIYCRSM